MKKTSKIFVFLLLIPTILLNFGCENKIKFPRTLYVTANSGLLIRAEPSTSAKKLGLALHGSQVTGIEQSQKLMSIQGKTGKWTKVSFEEITGWSFGGFLSQKKPGQLGGNTERSNQAIRCESWDKCQNSCYENRNQSKDADGGDEMMYECYEKCTKRAGGTGYVEQNCDLGC